MLAIDRVGCYPQSTLILRQGLQRQAVALIEGDRLWSPAAPGSLKP